MKNLIILNHTHGEEKDFIQKTNVIHNLNLSRHIINLETILNMFQSPQLTEDNKKLENSSFNNRSLRLLNEILETRFENGETTILDVNTHTFDVINHFEKLIKRHNYRVHLLDFSDVIKSHLKIIKPINEYDLKVLIDIKPEDFSCYKKIHHIGDIHGCYKTLKEYLDNNPIKEDECYIFVGDYLDRGLQNAETIQLLLQLFKKPNFKFLEGNHEIHLLKWALGERTFSKEFENKTKYDLEKYNINKKLLKDFYYSLRDFVYYTYHDKTVIVTHGGLASIPDNFGLISSKQLIKGVGPRSLDIDEIFENNIKNSNIFQVHGHRNNSDVPLIKNQNSFNLENSVEFGGTLRIMVLEESSINVNEITNSTVRYTERIMYCS